MQALAIRTGAGPHGQEAFETLQQVEHLQATTRATLQDYWFPLVLFGALTVASAAVRVGTAVSGRSLAQPGASPSPPTTAGGSWPWG